MDGFVRTAELSQNRGCSVAYPTPSVCLPSGPPDVMGYHDAREIPNYWTYARDFTLHDHMFEPVASWSLPAHLYLVSGWAAHCRQPGAGQLRQRSQPGRQPPAPGQLPVPACSSAGVPAPPSSGQLASPTPQRAAIGHLPGHR